MAKDDSTEAFARWERAFTKEENRRTAILSVVMIVATVVIAVATLMQAYRMWKPLPMPTPLATEVRLSCPN